MVPFGKIQFVMTGMSSSSNSCSHISFMMISIMNLLSGLKRFHSICFFFSLVFFLALHSPRYEVFLLDSTPVLFYLIQCEACVSVMYAMATARYHTQFIFRIRKNNQNHVPFSMLQWILLINRKSIHQFKKKKYLL